jgi:ZIP family zinc transporter
VTPEEITWMIVPAVGTGLGGLGILILGARSERALDMLMGFTAGVMLAATVFSLLVPALDLGELWEVVCGFVAGGAVLALVDAVLPHAHERFLERGHQRAPRVVALHRRAALLVSGLTIHNVPEGAAVGVAFAAGGADLGVPIALAITLQNVPEGFAAAAPLLETSAPRSTVAAIGAVTGLVEPPAAFAAFAAFSLSEALLPAGLAFAGAAMLYVVVDELLPECFARGNERPATIAFFGGFLLMMGLDAGLG